MLTTDRLTNKQDEFYIPPKTLFTGYNIKKCSYHLTLEWLDVWQG